MFLAVEKFLQLDLKILTTTALFSNLNSNLLNDYVKNFPREVLLLQKDRVIRSNCKQIVMLMRNKFLNDLKLICSKCQNEIALFNVFDFKHTLGISYLELNKLSDELGNYFFEITEGESQYIGISVTEYFQLPFLILGIWKSGCAFAGVGHQNTVKSNLDFLNFLQIKFLITDHYDNRYDGEVVSCFFINEQKFLLCNRMIERKPFNIKHICYGIMTSGSTGDMKTIQVPWKCILPNAIELSKKFQMNSFDCIFQASPYTFDPFFIEFFLTLLNGCSLIIVSNFIKVCPSSLLKILFEIDQNCILPCTETQNVSNHKHFKFKKEAVCRKKITFLQMTPSIFKRWSVDEIRNIVLSSNTCLRVLVLGGEKFPTEVLLFKSIQNKTKIFNIYGITEISCWALLNEVTNHDNHLNITLGKPLKNIVYKISGNELYLGSKTQVCIVNNEKNFMNKKLVFRNTGDIVKIVNNELYYVSRSNQIVKKYGNKVNLYQIEKLFLKKNKSIKECYCIFSEKNLKLGLFYLPVEKGECQNDYIINTLEGFLKKGYQTPKDEIKDIEKPDYFIEIYDTPLNTNGKCDKQYLIHYLTKVSTIQSSQADDLETIFSRIWSEVLALTSTELFSKSFKEYGGNSILAIEMINKLESEGIKVPQNFIVELLNNGNYKSSLQCVASGEYSRVPRKKLKLQSKNDFQLSVQWKFDLGKCVDATPSVFTHNGTDRIVIGSHSSKLTCLNITSGKEIWTISLGDRIESGFKVVKNGSRGFIGCYDNFIYCISVFNGNINWKYKTDDIVKSTPCLSSNEEIVYAASYDKHLYCINSKDGQLVKKLKISNSGVFSSGVVSQTYNTFFIGALDGICLAVSQGTNQIKWETKLKSPVFASPCLNSLETEVLFVEVLGIVHCMNSINGDTIWSYKAEGNIYSTPITLSIENLSCIIFGCHDSKLYCLQNSDVPKLKWKCRLDSAVFAKPCIVLFEPSLTLSQMVCASATNGFLYLCDIVSGSVISQINLEGEIFSSPVCKGNQLLVGCRDNHVYSLQILKDTKN